MKPKVSVICAECGIERFVRPSLVRGFDALVCARHHLAGHPASLVVPDGHVVTVAFDVAGYFNGYTVREPDRSEARSLWRAAALAAAAAGRPAPPPPAVADADTWQPVIDALTTELGTDGWELADAISERGRGGRVWTVKLPPLGWTVPGATLTCPRPHRPPAATAARSPGNRSPGTPMTRCRRSPI